MVTPVGYIDGHIGPLEDIRVPVLDRGFLYGDSIYEVFRTYRGVPFMFEEHHQRLLNSARLSMMHISQSREEIIDAIRQTIDAAEAGPGEDVYVRYQITRGEGAVDLYPDPELESRLIIIVKQVPVWNAEFYSRGMSLAIPDTHRNAVTSLDPNIKGGNYLNNILGLAEARAMGADECVMLDAQGMVSECSNSNVWFVIDGRPVTPKSGNLLGLTRKILGELLSEAGYTDIERPIHHEELAAATECFVTSATREVMPVCSLLLKDGTTISFPEGGGELTRQSMALYSAMLEDYIETHRDSSWFEVTDE